MTAFPDSAPHSRLAHRRHRRLSAGDTYWPHAAIVASLVLATVGLRVHESIAYLSYLRPAALAAYGGLFILLTKASRDQIRQVVSDSLFRNVAAYFAWMAVISPFALWPGLAIGTLQIAPPIIAMTVTVLLLKPDPRNADFMKHAFVVSACVLGFLSLMLRGTMVDAGAERLTSLGSLDANDLAAVMAMAFPFCLAECLRSRPLRRLFALTGAVLLMLVVLRSGSRGGSVALLVGALAFTLGVKGQRRLLLIMSLTATAAVGWAFAPDGFKARFASVSSETDYNYTAYSGRKQIWSRGRGYIEEHPITGVGPGNFPIAEGDYAAALGRRARWATAHNAFLQAFAELGLLGGVLYLSLLYLGFRRSLPLWRPHHQHQFHRPEYAASLIAFVTSACFLSHAYFYPLFALLSIVALASRASRARVNGGAPQLSANGLHDRPRQASFSRGRVEMASRTTARLRRRDF